MNTRIPFRRHCNDLHAALQCACGHKTLLAGYNDSNFFDRVNATPRERACQCGRRYRVQWFRDGVEIEPIALTPKQVAAAGYLLYGQAWTSQLARELQVTPRFLQRVSAAARDGEPFDVPPGFIADLRALAERRARELQAAAAELQTAETSHAH